MNAKSAAPSQISFAQSGYRALVPMGTVLARPALCTLLQKTSKTTSALIVWRNVCKRMSGTSYATDWRNHLHRVADVADRNASPFLSSQCPATANIDSSLGLVSVPFE